MAGANLDLPAFGDIVVYDEPRPPAEIAAQAADGLELPTHIERRFSVIGELDNGDFAITLVGEMPESGVQMPILFPLYCVPSAMLRRDGSRWRLDPSLAGGRRIITIR